MRPGRVLLLRLLLVGLVPQAGSGARPGCSPAPALPAFLGSLARGALPRADVIRSLRPHRVHKMGRKWNIIFKISVSQGEDLQLAELRLHLSTSGRKFPSTSDPIWVDLFHQQEVTCQNELSCPHIVRLGSFTVSPSFSSSWRVLEITEQLSKWFTNSSSVKKSFQNDPIRWNTKHGLKRVIHHCRSANKKAFLMLFSRFSKGKREASSSTLLQSVKSSKYFINRTPKGSIPLWASKRHRRHRKTLNSSLLSSEEPESKHLCRRVDFHVDFDQIGWGSWIVYPKQYNAFRCEGKCPVPLDEEFQPTNNAYMQNVRADVIEASSLIHLVLGGKRSASVTEPCTQVILFLEADLVEDGCGQGYLESHDSFREISTVTGAHDENFVPLIVPHIHTPALAGAKQSL